MSKLVRIEKAKQNMEWVKIDGRFMSDLVLGLRGRRMGHLECPKCHSAQFNIGIWNDAIAVGCTKCAWENHIPYEHYGSANLILPV